MQTRLSAARPESILVSRAQRGDLDAFNELVLLYQDLIYNLCLSIMAEPDQAEDVTQQAFINAFQHINGFRGGSFRSWLLRIATHACYDALRAMRRRPTVPLFPVDDNGNEAESPSWIADPRPSPQAKMESDEVARALYQRLDQLPRAYRAVVTLVDLNGIDYEEAARALGIPLGTVKSRLARARMQLREALSIDLGLSASCTYLSAAASS